MDGYFINTIPLTDLTAEIAASGNSTQDVTLADYKPQGFMSLQVTLTGTGTAQITHQSSNDGTTFATLNGASDIVTALTAGSAIYQFDAPFARYLRIKVEETGGANAVTLTTCVLALQ